MKKNVCDVLAAYAASSPFYRTAGVSRDCFRSMIANGPCIKKHDLQTQTTLILNDSYKHLDFNLFQVSRTSGSSGEPVEVFWSQDEYFRSNMDLWRLRKKYYDIMPSDKCVSFHSILYNKSKPMLHKKIIKLNYGKILSFSKFNLSDQDMDYYLKEICKYEPKWMLTQPSVIFKILDFLERYDRKLPNSLLYIELNGEQVSYEQEMCLRNKLKVNVANLYGSQEVNAIGYECSHGNMHIVSDNVYVQMYDVAETENSISGSILVSNLHNRVFPIIAYDLGDRITIRKSNRCPCGCNSPIIDSIWGRKSDDIILPNGKKISPFLFSYCIEYLNSAMGNPIWQYKVKTQKDKITLVVYISNNFSRWADSIKKELEIKIFEMIPGAGEINISIKPLTDIMISNSGKKKMVDRSEQ